MNVNDNKKLKVVISPVVAIKLCNKGYPILKLKKRRDNAKNDFSCEFVFLFEETENFKKDFLELVEKYNLRSE